MEALPGTLAVRVTVCAVNTEATLAVNAALVAFAGITTVAGNVTAGSFVATLTLIPPLGEAESSFNVQVSVAGPVMPPLSQ